MRGGLGGPSWRLAVERESRLWRDVSLRQLLRNVSSMSLSATISSPNVSGLRSQATSALWTSRPLVSGKQLAQTVQVSA